MEYSRKIEREISENGVEFDLGSVYAGFEKLTDVRKAKGKRYSLNTVMMIILMAKLCGEDKPLGIADWAKNRQAELIKLLVLERPSMPNHNTYRRILAYALYEDEIERLVGKYNQEGEHGEVSMPWMGKQYEGCERKTRAHRNMP